MAAAKQNVRRLNSCLRAVQQSSNSNASLSVIATRVFSTSTPSNEQVQLKVDSKWNELDPARVDNKRDERRVVRTGRLPIGSRRRRAVLRTQKEQIPFEQLPYQCFQEARKILQQDRSAKIKQIETQRARLAKLEAQDAAVSGGQGFKDARIRSMRNHLEELKVLADINDPIVKKKFEDGEGDMNKPIYRYLAERKWRQYKRQILVQRLTQMSIIPDVLPALDPVADIDLSFGRRKVHPGEFVDSRISESIPKLNVQVFDKGERLVTVVVVDADVPVPEKDSFTYRCHFAASNIPLSPTSTSIPLTRLDVVPKSPENKSSSHIALPWLAPWANKGAPYHRLAVFVLEQENGNSIDAAKVGTETKRDGFKLRSFIDKHQLKPITATLFRTQWDQSMPGVLRRAGLEDQINIEFKRKRIEPLPYKKRVERMR